MYLIETKAVLFSAFPSFSYLTSAILIRSTTRIRRRPGIRGLWTRVHATVYVEKCPCHQYAIGHTHSLDMAMRKNGIRVFALQYCRVQPVGEAVHSGYASCQSQLLALYQQLHQASFVKSGVQSRVQGPICKLYSAGYVSSRFKLISSFWSSTSILFVSTSSLDFRIPHALAALQ